MADFDLVVRGGEIATAVDVFHADIGVRGGCIAALAQGLPGESARSTRAASSCCPAASTPIAISTSRQATTPSWPTTSTRGRVRRPAAAPRL